MKMYCNVWWEKHINTCTHRIANSSSCTRFEGAEESRLLLGGLERAMLHNMSAQTIPSSSGRTPNLLEVSINLS